MSRYNPLLNAIGKLKEIELPPLYTTFPEAAEELSYKIPVALASKTMPVRYPDCPQIAVSDVTYLYDAAGTLAIFFTFLGFLKFDNHLRHLA